MTSITLQAVLDQGHMQVCFNAVGVKIDIKGRRVYSEHKFISFKRFMKHLECAAMHQPYLFTNLRLDRIERRREGRGGGNGRDVVCAANIRFRRIVLTSNIVKLKFGNSKGNIGELLNTTSEHGRTDTARTHIGRIRRL